ncbi:hypothetical protein IP84_08800 [beta proteobacterium AAP99]|nr:hypothetical protein IP84_08800 [beta proteobacterium AAP99]
MATSAEDAHSGQVLVTVAGQLAEAVPTVTPEVNNEALREMFAADEQLEVLTVVRDGQPMGLVNRNVFMEQYARPFGRDLFGREGCLAFAYKQPLVVEETTPIETIVREAVAPNSRVMKDGFVVTRGGQYLGLGSGRALIKAMSDIEQEKTRQLLASIEYASAIQRSGLRASDETIKANLPQAFLSWQPRDVVGGDCYFFRRVEGGIFGAIIDCTGHGVPGAFMTLITLAYMEQSVKTGDAAPDTGALLSGLNAYIKRVLGQYKSATPKPPSALSEKSDDGLDAVFFVLPEQSTTLRYAAARLAIMVIDEAQEEVLSLEGDKMGVGYSDTPDDFAFAEHVVDLGGSRMLAVTTDGIIDQIGGPKRIAFGRKRLQQQLVTTRAWSEVQAGDALLGVFRDWQDRQSRRDDVCLFIHRVGA